MKINLDRLVVLQLTILIFISIYFSFSVLTWAGILLMLGAFWIYQGNVMNSIVMYTLADFGWFANALQQDDKFGAFSVFIGILTGIAVMYKMNSGIFEKTLIKENR